MPRVSVIIPAYNAEAYLAETLRSVASQAYRDWEVIVADDCSTDRTVEVADSFDERFTVLPGPANQGPAAARNRALAVAGGELLAFLDADDLWLPGYLTRRVGLYDEKRTHAARVGIVTTDARLLGPEGYLSRTYLQAMGFEGTPTLSAMLVSNMIYGAALTPRAVVSDLGGFCLDLFGTEDYDLWLRILEHGYHVEVNREPLAVYRVRPGSVSSNLPRMARSFQLTYERALARGSLTPRQRRLARRQLRLQRALEQVGLALAERRSGGRPFARAARHLPLFVRVALENPDRWSSAARTLIGRGSPLAQVSK